ncbi:hypothetical protein D3C74_488990 [compost metagenome]
MNVLHSSNFDARRYKRDNGIRHRILVHNGDNGPAAHIGNDAVVKRQFSGVGDGHARF